MRQIAFALLALISVFQTARGQTPDEVVVYGERAGPRLWRIHDADSEVFILPSVAYLPETFEWDERGIAAVVSDVDQIFTPPRVSSGSGDNARFIGVLLRTLIFNRGRIYMAKGETLEQRIGADLAARLAGAQAVVEAREKARKSAKKAKKQKDGGENPPADEAALAASLEKVEPKRFHPFIQANQLQAEAASSAGLELFDPVEDKIKALARKNDVPVRPLIEKDLAFKDAKKLLVSMQNFAPETDRACVSEAIRFAEEDLHRVRALADAWARGDATALRAGAKLPLDSECVTRISAELGELKTFDGATFTEALGQGIAADALVAALERPGARLAIVLADSFLPPGGVLDQLRARGVEVNEP
jgi:hypothetical protein